MTTTLTKTAAIPTALAASKPPAMTATPEAPPLAPSWTPEPERTQRHRQVERSAFWRWLPFYRALAVQASAGQRPAWSLQLSGSRLWISGGWEAQWGEPSWTVESVNVSTLRQEWNPLIQKLIERSELQPEPGRPHPALLRCAGLMISSWNPGLPAPEGQLPGDGPPSESTVGVTQARDQLGQLITQVRRGQQVLITRHGVPVACLKPVGQHAGPIGSAQDLAQVRIRWKEVLDTAAGGRRTPLRWRGVICAELTPVFGRPATEGPVPAETVEPTGLEQAMEEA